MFLLLLAESLLGGCLLALLGGDGLGVSGTLGGGISHHLLVLLLCELLLGLSLGHLGVEVLDAAVDHGNDTSALLGLLGECLWGLRWRRGCVETLVHAHLHEHGRLLVQLGVVELVEAVLGHGEDL